VILAALTAAVVLVHPFGSPASRPAGLRSLAVHDGDRVRAFGQLVQSSNGPLLCTHVGVADTGAATSSSQPATRACGPFEIARLTGSGLPSQDDSDVAVTGVYAHGTITVDSVGKPTEAEQVVGGFDPTRQRTPCAAPAGGWKSADGTADYPDANALTAYVDAHHAVVGGMWMSTPEPQHKLLDAEGGTAALQVVTVGVAGGSAQVDQVRSQVSGLYHGPLCISAVPYAYRAQDDAGVQATAILGGAVIQTGHNEQAGREYVEATLLTDDQASRLAALGDVIEVFPHIVPDH
jgi:hypothetical protein